MSVISGTTARCIAARSSYYVGVTGTTQVLAPHYWHDHASALRVAAEKHGNVMSLSWLRNRDPEAAKALICADPIKNGDAKTKKYS